MCHISKSAPQQIFVGGRAVGLRQLHRGGNQLVRARRPQVLGNALALADIGNRQACADQHRQHAAEARGLVHLGQHAAAGTRGREAPHDFLERAGLGARGQHQRGSRSCEARAGQHGEALRELRVAQAGARGIDQHHAEARRGARAARQAARSCPARRPARPAAGRARAPGPARRCAPSRRPPVPGRARRGAAPSAPRAWRAPWSCRRRSAPTKATRPPFSSQRSPVTGRYWTRPASAKRRRAASRSHLFGKLLRDPAADPARCRSRSARAASRCAPARAASGRSRPAAPAASRACGAVSSAPLSCIAGASGRSRRCRRAWRWQPARPGGRAALRTSRRSCGGARARRARGERPGGGAAGCAAQPAARCDSAVAGARGLRGVAGSAAPVPCSAVSLHIVGSRWRRITALRRRG